MRRRLYRHDDTETALANFALTFAKALLVICVALFVMVSDPKPSDGIKPKVEAMMSITWPKEALADIDTWVRLPDGSTVNFTNKESGVVFLDRDDLGGTCPKTCEEIVSLRGFVPGDYILNLQVYGARNSVPVATGSVLPAPVTVHVKIIGMNPVTETLFDADVTLSRVKEERSVVRFTVANDHLGNFETNRPISIIRRTGATP